MRLFRRRNRATGLEALKASSRPAPKAPVVFDLPVISAGLTLVRPPAPPEALPQEAPAWTGEWTHVQLVFSDGTVSSLTPGSDLQKRMSRLGRELLGGFKVPV